MFLFRSLWTCLPGLWADPTHVRNLRIKEPVWGYSCQCLTDKCHRHSVSSSDVHTCLCAGDARVFSNGAGILWGHALVPASSSKWQSESQQLTGRGKPAGSRIPPGGTSLVPRPVCVPPLSLPWAAGSVGCSTSRGSLRGSSLLRPSN